MERSQRDARERLAESGSVPPPPQRLLLQGTQLGAAQREALLRDIHDNQLRERRALLIVDPDSQSHSDLHVRNPPPPRGSFRASSGSRDPSLAVSGAAWSYPTAGVPGWACGVGGAASRQLVVSHRWGTRLGVWCRWSCLSTAGGTPPLGYPAGRGV
jgi:hypothetical protein